MNTNEDHGLNLRYLRYLRYLRQKITGDWERGCCDTLGGSGGTACGVPDTLRVAMFPFKP